MPGLLRPSLHLGSSLFHKITRWVHTELGRAGKYGKYELADAGNVKKHTLAAVYPLSIRILLNAHTP